MKTRINRPWLTSFNFERALYSDTKLDQLHKLSRNFVAGLDLGCPSAKFVPSKEYGGMEKGLSQRDTYLLWVKQWKAIYKEISRIIRALKLARKTVHHPKPTKREMELCEMENRGLNVTVPVHLRGLSVKHLERLQETAMVLLNARWNAKLAAAESRRREMEKGPKALEHLQEVA